MSTKNMKDIMDKVQQLLDDAILNMDELLSNNKPGSVKVYKDNNNDTKIKTEHNPD